MGVLGGWAQQVGCTLGSAVAFSNQSSLSGVWGPHLLGGPDVFGGGSIWPAQVRKDRMPPCPACQASGEWGSLGSDCRGTAL